MNKAVSGIINKKIAAISKAAEEEVTVSKKLFSLELAVAFLGGIVIGMFLSPRRNSSYTIASNNQINSCEDEEDDEFEDDGDDDISTADTKGKSNRFIKL